MNFWKRKDVDQYNEYTCRYAHSAALINHRSFFVFGGIDNENFAMRNVFAYDVIDNKIIPLREEGIAPATRLGHGLLRQGGGMMLLYGGEDP